MKELDLIDQKILYELDLNARISAAELAKKLRKSKETINFRLNRLLSKQYLKGFYTVLNTSKLGWFYYKVYLNLRSTTPEKEQEMLIYLQQQDYVSYLASTSGSHDCIFLIMVHSPVEMSQFMNLFLGEFGEIIQEKEMVAFLTVHRFNQKFLYSGKIQKDFFYPIEIQNYSLEELDKQILNLLKNQARMSLTQMAQELNVDYKVISYHLKKLEKEKIILGKFLVKLKNQKH